MEEQFFSQLLKSAITNGPWCILSIVMGYFYIKAMREWRDDMKNERASCMAAMEKERSSCDEKIGALGRRLSDLKKVYSRAMIEANKKTKHRGDAETDISM